MRVSMTLNEVYKKLKDLRERRDLYAKIIADCIADDNIEDAELFKEKYKYIVEVIDYYSSIDVEFDNKYVRGNE